MNKNEFITRISETTEMTKKDVKAVIDALPEVIKECINEEGKVSLTGFITFEKKDVPEKSGVTRLGGVEKPWTTPAHSEIKVSLSKSYRQL